MTPHKEEIITDGEAVKKTFLLWIKGILFPVIASMLMTVIIAQGTTIKNDISEIRNDLNQVLRNPILQMNKNDIITRYEFSIYQDFRNRQMEDIKGIIKDELGQLRIEIRNPQVYHKSGKG
jgi:hypothetical protein